MFEKYYEKIYKALEPAGEGGLTVGKIARQIGHAKSTTWSSLQEMVDRELIRRVENYDHTDYKQVRYFYFQLPLFSESHFSQNVHDEEDYQDMSDNPFWRNIQEFGDTREVYEGWDGLRGCDRCGNDTTGRLCKSCEFQEQIDKGTW